jgi:hypothetical protein
VGAEDGEVLRISDISLHLQQVPWEHSGASRVFFEFKQGFPAFVLPRSDVILANLLQRVVNRNQVYEDLVQRVPYGEGSW